MSRSTFNWAGCGLPVALNLPTGTAGGTAWRLVVTATPLLRTDLPTLEQWEEAGRWGTCTCTGTCRVSWTYCGLARGRVPDSRPPGFPFDRFLRPQPSLSSFLPSPFVDP